MTNKISTEIEPKRTIYYSSILAFSSASLAFLGQYANKDSEQSATVLVGISIIGFGLSLIILIFLYFLQVLDAVQWGKINRMYEMLQKDEPLKDPMKMMEHKYFIDHKKDKESFRLGLYMAARILGITNTLDLLLFIVITISVASYTSFIFINLF